MNKLIFQNKNRGTATYLVERNIPVDNPLVQKHLIEYVTTTKGGRELLANPRLIGWHYRNCWKNLIRDSFLVIKNIRKLLKNLKESQITFVPMMTGGRDCCVDLALQESTSLEVAHQMEVYSKRGKSGRNSQWITTGWGIKGELSPGWPRTIVSADINATGATMQRFLATIALKSINSKLYVEMAHRLGVKDQGDCTEALVQAIMDRVNEGNFPATLREVVENSGNSTIKKIKPIENIIAVNIGSQIAGDIAAQYLPLYLALNPQFGKIYIIYSETVAEVAWDDTHLPVKNPGTSLLWRGGAAPQYISWLFRRPDPFPWEDCIIYYGSKRSRGVENHFPEMLETLIALAKTGEISKGAYDKAEHFSRITPDFIVNHEMEPGPFLAGVQKHYPNLPQEMQEQLFKDYRNFTTKVNWQQPLEEYCREKIMEMCRNFSMYNLEVSVALLSEKYQIKILDAPKDVAEWLWNEQRELLKGTLVKKVKLGEYTPEN